MFAQAIPAAATNPESRPFTNEILKHKIPTGPSGSATSIPTASPSVHNGKVIASFFLPKLYTSKSAHPSDRIIPICPEMA